MGDEDEEFEEEVEDDNDDDDDDEELVEARNFRLRSRADIDVFGVAVDELLLLMLLETDCRNFLNKSSWFGLLNVDDVVDERVEEELVEVTVGVDACWLLLDADDLSRRLPGAVAFVGEVPFVLLSLVANAARPFTCCCCCCCFPD